MAVNDTVEIKNLQEILASGSVMLWDASSLKCSGLKEYIQKNAYVIKDNRDKIFAPTFARSELAGPVRTAGQLVLERNVYSEIQGVSNYGEVFRQLKAAGHSSIYMVLNDFTKRPAIFDAAAAAKVTVQFCTLDDAGNVTEPPRRQTQSAIRPANRPAGKPANTRPAAQGFTIKDRPESITIAPIPVSGDLGVGDRVVDEQGKCYLLTKRKAVSNQAATYSTDMDGVWIKLFDRRALNTFTEAKIKRMVSQNITFDGICWPQSIVTDLAGNFRGYTLREFEGTPLYLSVFKRAGIETYFPNWTRLDLCDLTQTILKKVQFLHKKNILFGCINPAAILVVNKDKVFFVDTDNYQIDGFPTTGYNLSFTPPELLGKKIYLAKKENEYYAIAQLVFMLMMPGKMPYENGSDQSHEELARKMHFPYAEGRFTNINVLPGMWRMMWSHLDSLRGSFYNVFQKYGKFSTPETRRDAIYWSSAVNHYRNYLNEPKNWDSRAIYPTGFKREDGVVFYRCQHCGQEHPSYYFSKKYEQYGRICNGCLAKKSDVHFQCRTCGKVFYYTNETALFHKMKKDQDSSWKDQKYCYDCGKRANSVYRQRNCKDCGALFDILVKEHDLELEKPGYEFTRCKNCRDRRKAERAAGVRSGSSYGNTARSSYDYAGKPTYSSVNKTSNTNASKSPNSLSSTSDKKGLFGWKFR